MKNHVSKLLGIMIAIILIMMAFNDSDFIDSSKQPESPPILDNQNDSKIENVVKREIVP